MKSTWSSCVLPLLLVTSATALLWPALSPGFWKNNQPSFTKICLYSNDPSQFTPVCIMCPNTLYPIVLTTCVMGAAIPLNVSYTQANCIVGNCAVNLSPGKPGLKGKREVQEDTYGLSSLAYLERGAPHTTEDEDPLGWPFVPYTMTVNGFNVTVTSVEEYFVHSDQTDDYEPL